MKKKTQATNSALDSTVFLPDGKRHLGLVHLTCPGENTSEPRKQLHFSAETANLPSRKSWLC